VRAASTTGIAWWAAMVEAGLAREWLAWHQRAHTDRCQGGIQSSSTRQGCQNVGQGNPASDGARACG
jgi:hypothetical protein